MTFRQYFLLDLSISMYEDVKVTFGEGTPTQTLTYHQAVSVYGENKLTHVDGNIFTLANEYEGINKNKPKVNELAGLYYNGENGSKVYYLVGYSMEQIPCTLLELLNCVRPIHRIDRNKIYI